MGQLVAFVSDPAAWARPATVHSRHGGEKHRLSLQPQSPSIKHSPLYTSLIAPSFFHTAEQFASLCLKGYLHPAPMIPTSSKTLWCSFPASVSNAAKWIFLCNISSSPFFLEALSHLLPTTGVCPSAHNASCVPKRISSVKSHDLSQSRPENCGGLFCLSWSIIKLQRGSLTGHLVAEQNLCEPQPFFKLPPCYLAT